MLNSILANMIAGLGLSFSGLRMIDANLRQTTGRQLRGIVGRFTRNRFVAAVVGIVTGALVQSSSGIAFILVSLVTSGLTTVSRALPVITWANVGCSALVFVAVLDLRLGVLYLVGLAGAAFAFDRSHRSEALSAVFGIGMLFYGLELMQTGSEPLKSLPWVAGLLNGNGESLILPFVGGAAFSFVTQSSSAVSILAIGLVQSGLLGPFPAMMALYGANTGSTFARMVWSTALRGSVRQLTAFQDLFKIVGAVVFIALLYAEARGGVPLVHALAAHLSSRVDRQMAFVFLTFNLTMAVTFTALQSPILRVLERWLPAEEVEDASKPRFLYDEALSEPATALDLIALEQARLVRRLLTYPEAMRTSAGSAARDAAQRLHAPFLAVAHRVEQFQQELLHQHLGAGEGERLAGLQSRLSLIVYLEDSLRLLTSATSSVSADHRLRGLVSSFVEGLDFVLMTLVDALESKDPEVRNLLLRISGDRGDLVERIRQQYLVGESAIPAGERALLLQVTSIFERVVWMAQRLGRLLDGPSPLPTAAAAASTSSAAPPGLGPPAVGLQ
jgi:phosphate:Na+ symporter